MSGTIKYKHWSRLSSRIASRTLAEWNHIDWSTLGRSLPYLMVANPHLPPDSLGRSVRILNSDLDGTTLLEMLGHEHLRPDPIALHEHIPTLQRDLEEEIAKGYWVAALETVDALSAVGVVFSEQDRQKFEPHFHSGLKLAIGISDWMAISHLANVMSSVGAVLRERDRQKLEASFRKGREKAATVGWVWAVADIARARSKFGITQNAQEEQETRNYLLKELNKWIAKGEFVLASLAVDAMSRVGLALSAQSRQEIQEILTKTITDKTNFASLPHIISYMPTVGITFTKQGGRILEPTFLTFLRKTIKNRRWRWLPFLANTMSGAGIILSKRGRRKIEPRLRWELESAVSNALSSGYWRKVDMLVDTMKLLAWERIWPERPAKTLKEIQKNLNTWLGQEGHGFVCVPPPAAAMMNKGDS